MSALPFDSLPAGVAKVLAKTKDISVMPQVVFKIMEMTGGEEGSPKALEQAILVDPGFAAKLLTRANSAEMGLPRKVTSIRDATGYLGLTRVRQLAMAVGVFDMFVGKTDRESLRRRSWWRQSLETAMLARCVAEEAKIASTEEAYTAGLLHLIGKTMLCRFDPGMYSQVEDRVNQGEVDFKAERHVFACDHMQVLSALADRWGFPERLCVALDYRSEPAKGEAATELRTALACAINLRILANEEPHSGLQMWPFEHAGIGQTQQSSIIERSRSLSSGNSTQQ